MIQYEDFANLDMRVATVTAAAVVEGADKLLKLSLDVGDAASGGLGERTVVSGIREYYQPEELIGKQVVYLANLEPRTIRGVESQGMILAAEGDRVVLLGLNEKLLPGSKVC